MENVGKKKGKGSSKKILQVCAIDVSIDHLLSPLIEKTMQEGFISHNACANTGRFQLLRDRGFHMIDIPIDRKISPISNLKTIWKMYQLIRSERYDIVHVHTPIAALLGRIAAKLARTPYVIYTAHGFYFHEGMKKSTYRFFYLLEKWAARLLTDWLLLQSKEDYELCVRKKFKKRERIIHLSNGVDIANKFNPGLVDQQMLVQMREELQVKSTDIVFAFIGRFVREKGILELMQAFQKLSQQRPDVKLILIGDVLSSERDQSLNRLLENYLANPSIIKLGFRKDIPDLLALSDVFVLPSHREGLPRSIIEAMAMEKPIIASNIRGCREEVFHGENGFLFEKNNSEQLYEYMLQLAENPSLRKRMGLRSRELAEELFDERKVVEKQLELFNSLL
ncbi:MAG: glycosyltransferase family 1 protein [Cohnella sp.]|uniref:glycosyltransferase family 4 protein n=1 Tax=Cohnella sp. TaxID=1883426 RepID=UPI000E38C25D|nr:glycosyltransferase family 4 protein [Cohnella sp.]REK66485.1 MAG: glycosyltransferase family 1 protein [Cohnella sp.]